MKVRPAGSEPVLSRVGPITLTASIGGTAIGKETWKDAGDKTFVADVPESALRGDAVTVDFSLDKFLPGGTVEIRELGIIVQSIGFESR